MWTDKQGEGMVKLLDSLSPETGINYYLNYQSKL